MAEPDSRLWAGELDGLVGRDEVLAGLRRLLENDSRAAVVTGIAGAGKTAVLRAVARASAAQGHRVLALTCQESDRGLPFTVLVDLLSLLPDSQPVLDLVIADATPAVNLDPLRLRLAVLDLLERASDAGPLLLVVDDVQWCDESSLSVLGFLSHRLAGSPVSALFAARGDASPAPVRRHPQVALPPLSDKDAATLLQNAGLELDTFALPWVLEQAAGNPLAVLELSRAVLTPGTARPSDAETAFREQVQALPAETRKALLLAALGDGSLAALGRVLGPSALLAALAPAETVGLVFVAERAVRFRHPLVRTAVQALASAGDRLGAHEDLATAYVDDPQRAAWHRAEATIVPDDEVAQELVAASALAEQRGAGAEAARFLVRASELSPDPDRRDQHLLAAVDLTIDIGNFDWAVAAAERLRTESSDPEVQVRAELTMAYALAQTDRSGAARRALVDVIRRLVDVDPALALISLTSLAVVSYRAGWDTTEIATWLETCDRAAAVLGTGELTKQMAGTRAWIRMQIDPLASPADIVALVREAPVLESGMVASNEMVLGAAAWLLDEPAIALERLGRAREMMQRSQRYGEMTQCMLALGLVQFAVGDYDAAENSGRQTLDFAEARNQYFALMDGYEIQARVAGVRGDVERARELCTLVLRDLQGADAVGYEANLRVTMSRVRLAEHDLQGSWNEIRRLFTEDGQPWHVHISYRELGHYAVAAGRVGATEQLARVLAVADERMPDPRAYHRLQLARARAQLEPDDAEQWYAETVADPVMAQWPFELANTQLEYGAWLRRRHRPTDARAQLQAAHDTFTRLGATYWMEQAGTELRAAGVSSGRREPTAWSTLTSQEREVVRLAASGMTNREIGATLFLSPRTVSAHLYRAFPKLGVTARAQLRDVVEDG